MPFKFLHLLLLIFVVHMMVVSPAAPQTCKRVGMTCEIAWLRSVAWDPVKEGVVVTDQRKRNLWRLSLEGDCRNDRDLSQGLVPEAVAQLGGGFVQLPHDEKGLVSEIRWLDRNFQSVRKFDLRGQEQLGPSSGYRPLSVYDWTVVGDQVFFFGAVEHHSSQYTLGFFRQPLTRPGAELVWARHQDVVVGYYLLGFPYMVAIGDIVYFLEMGTYPTLYRYDVRDQDQAPISIRDYPSNSAPLYPIDADAETIDVFDTVEQVNMPAGLYVAQSNLYVLNRQLSPDGGTNWTLTKLWLKSTEAFVVVEGTVALPTHAPYLTLFKTPKEWLVFEGSKVGRGGYQQISKMLRIPADWIEQVKTSPLALSRRSKIDCEEYARAVR